MADKFVVFEDAAQELKMTADELKKLVEEGKIRSFMDSGKTKFRRKDVDDLKESLGIIQAEEEISLAPPEEAATGKITEIDDDELPPPPPVAAAPAASMESEFSIEPLDEAGAKPSMIGGAPIKKAAAPAVSQAEEEVASLEEMGISSAMEEQGQELSGDEAELMAMQTPGLRGYEEAKAANVGMTVLLVAAVVMAAFGVAVLLCFPASINPFTSLTSFFAS